MPEMDSVDRDQQIQIDSLMSNQRFMFWILVINTVASVAQILECVKVWISLKG